MDSKNTKKTNSILIIGLGSDCDYFTENLSMLIASGMNILDALKAVNDGVRSRRMRKIIDRISDEIESGSTLWSALDNTHLFKQHIISLIKIGEESGRLSENLRVVSLEQEKDRVFRSKIRSAMMYPVFVLALTVIVGVGIAWFILPKLSLVFAQLKIELPWITKMLIGAGMFFGHRGALAVPIVLAAIAAVFYFIFYFPKTKFVGQALLLKIPGAKRLILEVELARFGYLLGTLLQAGLPVNQALDSLAQASSFPRYKKFYEYLTRCIDDGISFKKSFSVYHRLGQLIPAPVQQLIIAGEQSGNLSEILLKISQTYEAKSETTTKNLSVIIEPVLLVIVWLGVVAVALAVILPIYGLIGGLKV